MLTFARLIGKEARKHAALSQTHVSKHERDPLRSLSPPDACLTDLVLATR